MSYMWYMYTSDFDEKHDSDIDEMSHFLLLLKAFFMDSFFDIFFDTFFDTFFRQFEKPLKKGLDYTLTFMNTKISDFFVVEIFQIFDFSEIFNFFRFSFRN